MSEMVPATAKNRNAIVSMICGLGGWILYLLLFCFNLTIGLFLSIVTFGMSAFCLLPLACISPIMWIIGAVTGHISLGQIKNTGEGGRGLALTGLIASYLGLGLILAAIIVLVVFIIFFGGLSIINGMIGNSNSSHYG